MIMTDSTITLTSRRCSEKVSDKNLPGLGGSRDEDREVICEHFNQHFWVHVLSLSHGLGAFLALECY